MHPLVVLIATSGVLSQSSTLPVPGLTCVPGSACPEPIAGACAAPPVADSVAFGVQAWSPEFRLGSLSVPGLPSLEGNATPSPVVTEDYFGQALFHPAAALVAADALSAGVPEPIAGATVGGPVVSARLPAVEYALPGADTVRSQRPMAREYSQAYYTRLAIHYYASYATIPLFATEFYLGQSLYNAAPGASNDGLRTAHSAVAYGIAGLFIVNTVTGVWNLWDGRKNPEGRARRFIHSFLMIVSDAGFVATGASAPGHPEHRDGTVNLDYGSQKSQHRTIALTSMGTALAGYLMMLIWK